ncbi:hypothetical protein PFICI_06615 [Pestalotiopsis fici W106-1]|uniref:Zn(2)-C6 fungal-type domain-containing protein n=1 Tax=Pestalotiopsis fici (strain W106-1 / CGMCC3.15140) TaxID=1229662 RepID=W3X666_PESFW|nr:uncharacterized protein PFICI_06615 [Pestalotiopsis fici W106-1]ETS81613.1 hypothetical protein PFICI_06615 [Pestalotiopsis fici W106-1]
MTLSPAVTSPTERRSNPEPRKKRKRSSRGCLPCKTRKVKCDENPEACSNCTRLGFECQYEDGSSESVTSLTKKRTRQACVLCRNSKLRCSGSWPKCDRCHSHELDCVYEKVGTGMTTVSEEPASPFARGQIEGQTEIHHPESTSLDLRRSILQIHIDAFFHHVWTTSAFNFIHKGSFLRSWHTGAMAKNLVRVVTSVSSRFVSNRPRSDNGDSFDYPGPKWLADVELAVFRDLSSLSIPRLQILLLLIFDHLASGRLVTAWNLLALASTHAFALKLNHPTDAVLPTNQECRRRLIWCVYYLDKVIGCEGLGYPSQCPREKIRVTLPCDDRLFGLEQETATPYLQDMVSESLQNLESLGVTAYLIRILDLREQIQIFLQFEGKDKTTAGLWDDGGRFMDLRRQLAEFQNLLPPEMRNNERALFLRASTPDAGVYTMVHSWLHTAACELYLHFLEPTTSADQNVSPDKGYDQALLDRCRDELARHANTLHQFWARLHSVQRYSERFFVTDTTIARCVYINTRSMLLLTRYQTETSGLAKTPLHLNLEILEPLAQVSPYVGSWVSHHHS